MFQIHAVGILALFAVTLCWSLSIVLYRTGHVGSVARKLALLMVVEGVTLISTGFIDLFFTQEARAHHLFPAWVKLEEIIHTLGDCAMLALYPPFLAAALQTKWTQPFAGRRMRIGIAGACIMLFFAVLMLVFQAVFTWATPMMDTIDGASSNLGRWIVAQMGQNAFSSFLADGVIAGVGSVIIFLPQILILFLFIIILEDTGYLARTSFLMDRVMRSVGLSGQSVIPMLSSFACAVPAIMATRVIPGRKDRHKFEQLISLMVV